MRRLVSLGLIIAGAALWRIAPHPANVAPIASLAIFFGFRSTFASAILIPLTAQFTSDLAIGFSDTGTTIVIYSSIAFAAIIASRAHLYEEKKNTHPKKFDVPKIIGITLGNALFFYLSTNAAVWWWSGMYERTFAGLMQSYILALPFFKNSIIGDFLFVALFFGAYETIIILRQRKNRSMRFHPCFRQDHFHHR